MSEMSNLEKRLENIESLMRIMLINGGFAYTDGQINEVINKIANVTDSTAEENVVTNFFVEYDSRQMSESAIFDKAKEKIKESDESMLSNMKKLNLYYKLDENKCYAVYNAGMLSEKQFSFDL